MPREILVPIDGSPKSTEGLEYALSTYGDASITVLHVLTPHDVDADDDTDLSGDVVDEWYQRARADADEILDEARALADEYDRTIDTVVEVGEPWRTIVDYADEHDVDHVIMGSHGRRDDAPVPLGSVAQTVMRRSPVLVSIVR